MVRTHVQFTTAQVRRLKVVARVEEISVAEVGRRCVDEELHEEGLDLLQEDDRRRMSLVDAVSFATARERGLEVAFAFGRHFAEAGLQLLR